MSPAIAGRLSVVQGDITSLDVEAIVNAANPSLLGGGGVDGAIHRRAGPGLLAECRALGGCPAGEARLTAGHGLRARHVIHAVGPRWRGGSHGEADLLASCYRESLRLAASIGAASVAFPCLATGSYGYPPDQAGAIAVSTVAGWLAGNELPARVVFCCFTAGDTQLYRVLLDALDEPPSPAPSAFAGALASIRWLTAAESPFGIPVMDCREFAASMISATAAPGVAERFLDLRLDDGARLRGTDPADAHAMPAGLSYRTTAPWLPGPLFRAAVMEEKWDLSLHDDTLFCSRSWTGSLEFRARLSLRPGRVDISSVVAAGTHAAHGEAYAVAVVDYLVRSHALGLDVPHPLPPAEAQAAHDVQQMAFLSFSLYGRRGRYGTFADPARLPLTRAAG